MKTISPITTERLNALGLNWGVEKTPLWIDDHFGPRKSGAFAVVRADNGRVLADAVGARYTTIQNTQLAELATAVESTSDAKFATGGSFRNDRLVYMSLRLPKDVRIDSKDYLETYLVLSNPHDGTGTARVNISTVRPVCMNTLRMAWTRSLESIFERVSLRHTKGVQYRMDEVRADLSKALAAVSVFEAQAQALRSYKPSERDIDAFLKVMGFSVDEAEGKKREEEMEFRRLLITAPGQDLAGNSAWRLLNGATYYVDHVRVGRNKTASAHEYSKAFGSGAELKDKAFRSVLDMAGIK